MLFGRSLLLLGGIFILGTIGYLILYNRSINRRMQQCTGGVHLPSPGRITLHLLFVCLASALACGCFLSASEPVRIQGARSWLQVFSAEELPGSWAGVYSQDVNPGYTRREVQDGDYSFIVFESETPHDGLHPDFLVFFRHTGGFEAQALSWHGSFAFTESEQSSGLGAGGSASEYFLAAGSAEADAVFTLNVTAYSDKADADLLADFAAEGGASPGGGAVCIPLHAGISP